MVSILLPHNRSTGETVIHSAASVCVYVCMCYYVAFTHFLCYKICWHSKVKHSCPITCEWLMYPKDSLCGAPCTTEKVEFFQSQGIQKGFPWWSTSVSTFLKGAIHKIHIKFQEKQIFLSTELAVRWAESDITVEKQNKTAKLPIGTSSHLQYYELGLALTMSTKCRGSCWWCAGWGIE